MSKLTKYLKSNQETINLVKERVNNGIALEKAKVLEKFCADRLINNMSDKENLLGLYGLKMHIQCNSIRVYHKGEDTEIARVVVHIVKDNKVALSFYIDNESIDSIELKDTVVFDGSKEVAGFIDGGEKSEDELKGFIRDFIYSFCKDE